MSNPRRRKHDALFDPGVLSPIENEPSSKRCRTSARNRITRSIIQTNPVHDPTDLPLLPQSRTGKRKRDLVEAEPEVVNDENQFNDLEESLKRLRIRRPIIFSITSFVEQNVDSVTYNLTDQEPELVTTSDI